MDGLAELIPLLLVAAYYLLQGRRRAAQRRAAQQRQEAPQEPLVTEEETARPGSSPFQQFLEQLEEAMAEAAGEPGPEAETASAPEVDRSPPPEIAPPPPVVPTRLPPAPPRYEPEFRAVEGSFDSATPTDHGQHGFGIDNPLSEESFERRPAFSLSRRGPGRAYDPHGLGRRPAPPRGAPESDLQTRLRDPKTARDAFVLQTIFGPRGGRRGDGR